jgi:nicotinate phosphoribosyltransferase
LEKIINPGHKHAWRIYDRRGMADTDLLSMADEDLHSQDPIIMRHPTEHATYRSVQQAEITDIEPLHVDVLKEGKLVYDLPSLDEMREKRVRDLERLDPGVRRIMNPHIYHVSLSEELWVLKQDLINKLSSKI